MFKAIMTPQTGRTKAEIVALGAANTAVAGFIYLTSDTNAQGVQEYGYGQQDGSVAWFTSQGSEPIQGIADTPTVNLEKDANGIISANAIVSTDNDSVLQSTAGGLKVPQMQVAPESAGFLNVTYDANGVATIKVEELLISRPTIVPDVAGGGAANLTAYLATNYQNGNEFQMSDHIIIQETGKVYIHNGGTAGDENDFSKVNIQGYTDTAIRALFSGDDVLDYNSTTGKFSFKLDPTSDGAASRSANGFKIDTSEGHITDTHDFLPGIAAPTKTIQMLFDAMGGVAKTALQSHLFSGDTGSFTIDQANANFGIKGGTLLKTEIVGNNAQVDFDLTGATLGQVVKVVDVGGGVLDVALAEDSAAGFSHKEVPYADENGVLFGDIQKLSFDDTEGNAKLWVNFGTNKIGEGGLGGDIRSDANFVIDSSWNYTDPSQHSRNSFSVQRQTLNLFSNNSESGNTGSYSPIVRLRGGLMDNNGDNTDMPVGFRLGSIEISGVTGNEFASWPNEANNWKNTNFTAFKGEISEVTGTIAGGDYKVGTSVIMNTRNAATGEAEAFRLDHNKDLTLAGLVNTRNDYNVTNGQSTVKNLIYTDANGKLQSMGMGTDGQVMKIVNDGNGNLSIQWVTQAGVTINGLENGLSYDVATGIGTLGGNLKKDSTTTITGTNNDSLQRSSNMEWLNINDYTIDAKVLDLGGASELRLTAGNITGKLGGLLQLHNDSTGKAEYTPFAFPVVTGTTGQFLKLDATGKLVWATESTPLSNGSGISFNNNKVDLGGTLTKAADLDLKDFVFHIKDTGTNSTAGFKSDVDLEFTDALVGAVFVAPEDSTKWRVGVSSLGNGAATFTLNQVV